MKNPSQPQGIMYEIVIIIESESKELWPLNQAAFRISDRLHTVFLYSIAQLGCETRLSLAFKMVKIFIDHMSQNAWQLSDLLGFLHPPNHKRVMPASCKPCLITHQQSQSHRARTVVSSRISDTLVSSRMASPVKWKFRKEPYQLNFKQNWNNINVIYTIINTKNCIIIITFQGRYVRKDSNCHDVAQNIHRKMFLAIFSMFIRYAILRFNTYTNP